MSGKIYQFGLMALPEYESREFKAQWSIPAQARTTYVNTLGGLYDASGSDQAEIKLPFLVTTSAIAYAPTASALGATLDTYRAMLGKRDRLWIDPYDTTQTDRWCWARLVDVDYTAGGLNRLWQPVTLVFEALSGWQGHAYGGSWTLDAGYMFDSGLWLDSTGATTLDGDDDIALPNAGNRTCTNVGITLTAGDTPVTTFSLTITDVAQLSWTGTLAATKSLVIDCGARRILNDGAGAYSGLVIGPNQYSPHWLPIAAGGATVHVTCDGITELGTSPTLQFTYADAWN